MVRTQTQNGTTLTYSLDAAGRLRAFTNSATGVTKTNHYDDASGDSPDWISETTDHSGWTRNITDLAGNLASTIDQAGTLIWQVTNLHGDTVATAASGATEPDTYYRTDEYGLPIGTAASRYGWLGGKQRSSEDLAGLVLMGVRLYNPQLGRFLQTDPVPGGSANDYDYANQNPINTYDLDGRMIMADNAGGSYVPPPAKKKHHWWSKVGSAIRTHFKNNWRTYATIGVALAGVAGAFACGVTVICGIAVGAAIGFASYSAQNAGTRNWRWRDAAITTGVGAFGGFYGARLNAGARSYQGWRTSRGIRGSAAKWQSLIGAHRWIFRARWKWR
jgi:RHS repeat-associated protein